MAPRVSCLGVELNQNKRRDRARARIKTMNLQRWQKVPFWTRGQVPHKDEEEQFMRMLRAVRGRA